MGSITHTFVSAVTDAGNPGEVSPDDWNAAHTITGPLDITAQTRNRVVNGAMQISQENGNTAVNSTGQYPADQWVYYFSGTTGNAAQRVSTTTPNGSRNTVYFTCATKASLAAGDYIFLSHNIEGLRIDDFQWGTANAKQVILRFWVNATAAGSYSVSIRNNAGARSWVGLFVIAAGEINTWVTRSFIIPGDTTGVWPIDNTRGMEISFTLATGTTLTASALGWNAGNYIAAPGQSNGTGQYLNISDVGLYLDPQATGVAPAWEMPDYAEELIACSRYWTRVKINWGGNVTSGVAYWSGYHLLRASMRIAGAASYVNDGASGFPTTTGGGNTYTETVSEYRTANATVNGAVYGTTVTVNARM